MITEQQTLPHSGNFLMLVTGITWKKLYDDTRPIPIMPCMCSLVQVCTYDRVQIIHAFHNCVLKQYYGE